MVSNSNGKIFRIIGVFVIVFGIIGLVSSFYAYISIQPRLNNIPIIVERLYGDITSATEDFVFFLDKGEIILFEIAEKTDFSLTEWQQLKNIEEDLLNIANSISDINKGIITGKQELQLSKDVILSQFDLARKMITVIFLYSSTLHAIFIFIGISFWILGGYKKPGVMHVSEKPLDDKENPMEILKLRLAIGEIDQEEFEKLSEKIDTDTKINEMNEKDNDSV